VTDRVLTCTKVAVTVCAAVICTVHVDCVPVQPPDQPLRTQPLCGAAVRVTVAVDGSGAEHVEPEPHVIPPPETEPFPLTVTLSVFEVGAAKLAPTDWLDWR
jgi:hypothetical protein